MPHGVAQGQTEKRQHASAAATVTADPGRPDPYGVLRKIPTQDRSRRKVQAILDAGDKMLAKEGYRAVASNPAELCKRARVTMGTFYTYFSNTHAVLEALRLRWLESVYAKTDQRLAGPFERWQEVTDATVDWCVEFYAEPPVRALWLGQALTPTSGEALRATHLYVGKTMSARIRALGVDCGGDETDDLVAIELIDALTRTAYREGRGGRPKRAIVKSTKRATRAYLATQIDPA